jgi:hypothetical protein
MLICVVIASLLVPRVSADKAGLVDAGIGGLVTTEILARQCTDAAARNASGALPLVLALHVGGMGLLTETPSWSNGCLGPRSPLAVPASLCVPGNS